MEPEERTRLKNKKGKIPIRYTDKIELYANSSPMANFNEFQFRRELSECKLSNIEIELTFCRVVDKFTWDDVASKLGITKSQARGIWKVVKQKLKDANYEK